MTHQVVVDWDGTAVPSCWPGKPTEFLPGFVDAMWRLHREGVRLIIQSARMTHFTEDAILEEERRYIRDTLDAAGLTFIDIWTERGKPPGSVYVDDRAERYHGRPKSWAKLADKILLRLDADNALIPTGDTWQK